MSFSLFMTSRGHDRCGARRPRIESGGSRSHGEAPEWCIAGVFPAPGAIRCVFVGAATGCLPGRVEFAGRVRSCPGPCTDVDAGACSKGDPRPAALLAEPKCSVGRILTIRSTMRLRSETGSPVALTKIGEGRRSSATWALGSRQAGLVLSDPLAFPLPPGVDALRLDGLEVDSNATGTSIAITAGRTCRQSMRSGVELLQSAARSHRPEGGSRRSRYDRRE